MPDMTERNRPVRARFDRRTLVATTTGAAVAATMLPRHVAAQSTPESGSVAGPIIPVYPHGQEISLDPHTAINWGPHWIFLPWVWAGLLGFDERGLVVPVLASSVEPEEDGRVWVAAIRPEATFASGNPVTADAMIAGWQRALRPQRLAPMAQYMSRVEGFDAYTTGESEEIGFEARDEHTVAITLAEPYALFREELATFVWAAVDMSAVEAVPESQVPYSGASAGRWQFMENGNSDDILLASRDDMSGTSSSFVAATLRPMEGPFATEDAITAARSDEMAIADVPTGTLAQLGSEGEIPADVQLIEPAGSTMLIGMDFRQAPFDDARVRQAIAHAIDREQWANEIMHGSFSPAESITPPVIAESLSYAPPSPIAFDPDAARSLVAEAGIDEDSMPTIVYYQPATAPQAEIDQLTALLEMIQEHTGLIVSHDLSLTAEQIDAMRRDDQGLQFDLRWWWPMTSSLSGLADLGSPDSPAMEGWFNWSAELEDDGVAEAAEQFAELVSNASLAMDSTERTQLFAQAERLLIENAVYVPLGHALQGYIPSEILSGTRHGAFTGYLPLTLDEEVSWAPPPESTPIA